MSIDITSDNIIDIEVSSYCESITVDQVTVRLDPEDLGLSARELAEVVCESYDLVVFLAELEGHYAAATWKAARGGADAAELKTLRAFRDSVVGAAKALAEAVDGQP